MSAPFGVKGEAVKLKLSSSKGGSCKNSSYTTLPIYVIRPMSSRHICRLGPPYMRLVGILVS